MVEVRRARLADVPRMMTLLNKYVQQAEILPRSEDDVYRSIREWVVAEADHKIVGVGSLVIMWRDLAEIRSLVINPAYQGRGLGRQIVAELITEARQLDLPKIFALTRKPGFFLKMGFQLTRIEKLPRKVVHDCVFCPIFHSCDEAALIMLLSGAPVAARPAVVQTNGSGPEPQSFITTTLDPNSIG